MGADSGVGVWRPLLLSVDSKVGNKESGQRLREVSCPWCMGHACSLDHGHTLGRGYSFHAPSTLANKPTGQIMAYEPCTLSSQARNHLQYPKSPPKHCQCELRGPILKQKAWAG